MDSREHIHRRAKTLLLIATFCAASAYMCLVGEAGSARANEEPAASGQLQACTQAALAEPEFNPSKAATMSEPGNRELQSLFTVAGLHRSSTDCLSLVRREGPRVYFKMQRPANHKKWIRSRSQRMITKEGSAAVPRVLGDQGGRGEAAVLAKAHKSMNLGEIADGKFIYKCTPGKAVTQVRVVFVMTARSAANGQVLRERSYSAPVKIIHAIPGEPLLHGAVFKAC